MHFTASPPPVALSKSDIPARLISALRWFTFHVAGKPLSFDWLAIHRSEAPQPDSDEDEDDTEDLSVDDPFGMKEHARKFKPMGFGGRKRVFVHPDSVKVGDFLIVRAKPIEGDASSFKIGDYNVPLWLCKVRGVSVLSSPLVSSSSLAL